MHNIRNGLLLPFSNFANREENISNLKKRESPSNGFKPDNDRFKVSCQINGINASSSPQQRSYGPTDFFTDSSLQASQQGTRTQGVTKVEEKRIIEAKESDTSTTRPRYETSFDE